MAGRGTGRLTFANQNAWDEDVWKALDIDGDLSSCIANLDSATPGTELVAAPQMMVGGTAIAPSGRAGLQVSTVAQQQALQMAQQAAVAAPVAGASALATNDSSQMAQIGMDPPPSMPSTGKRRRITDPKARLDRSRERNRFHAKRSRLRKKFLLQNLEQQAKQLQQENTALKKALLENLPQDKAATIMKKLRESVDTQDGLELLYNEGQDGGDGDQQNGAPAPAVAGAVTGAPSAALAAASSAVVSEVAAAAASSVGAPAAAGGATARASSSATVLDRHDFMLVQALQGAQHNFVITNPNMPDNPIVYASSGFYTLTGFPPEEVMGRNCRFLQGPGTDQRAVQRIRDSITRGQDCQVCLLNYRKDGTPFYNQFFIAPLRGKDSHVVENFIGVQCPVSKEQYEIFQKSQFARDQKEAEARRKASGGSAGGIGGGRPLT